ncbi:MAG: hypothetical protein D6677_13290 [Calditrichaeota bacterium]|nr:MAG: hypothetical protein D6677_13290 [Calditrichota bacterium]
MTSVVTHQQMVITGENEPVDGFIYGRQSGDTFTCVHSPNINPAVFIGDKRHNFRPIINRDSINIKRCFENSEAVVG